MFFSFRFNNKTIMSVNYCIYAVKMLRKNRNGHCVAAVSNAYGVRQTTCMATVNSIADGRHTVNVVAERGYQSCVNSTPYRANHWSISLRAIDSFCGMRGILSYLNHAPLDNSERCKRISPDSYSAIYPAIKPQG